MKLAVGAAQMGMAYGVANRTGQVGPERARQLLDTARAHGVDTIDTAAAYGDSEMTLGAVGSAGFRVVTKIGPVPDRCSDPADWVVASVRASCGRLRRQSVHGVLLHRSEDLFGPHARGIIEGLQRLPRLGLAERVGLSVYSPDELERSCEVLDAGIVQLPRNPLDRRFERSGWIRRLAEAGVEVHVRSIFLQGLLAMPPAEVPARFSQWRGALSSWHRWLSNRGIGAIEACIRDAMSEPAIDRIVTGFDSPEQMAMACEFSGRAPERVPEEIAVDDLDLLLPFRWPKP
jgi:aryl-alcohol dehydrogenase-like predicted oxidoreductase